MWFVSNVLDHQRCLSGCSVNYDRCVWLNKIIVHIVHFNNAKYWTQSKQGVSTMCHPNRELCVVHRMLRALATNIIEMYIWTFLCEIRQFIAWLSDSCGHILSERRRVPYVYGQHGGVRVKQTATTSIKVWVRSAFGAFSAFSAKPINWLNARLSALSVCLQFYCFFFFFKYGQHSDQTS